MELAALPLWVYINLKKKIGQQKAFEIMRAAILSRGIVQSNLACQAVDKERSFENLCDQLTPVVCQFDNAAFNSCLPDRIAFDRAGPHRRIADGKSECNFVWESRVEASA